MAKFERNPETGKYECPECEREYEKYNGVFQHYKRKHGNSPIVEKVNRTGKSITNKTKETLKTVTKGIMSSDSGNDPVDDDNKSTEIENSSSVAPKKKTKRVRLKPVEPPVKKPDKNEEENEEETESENWLIHGILHGFSKNEQKLSEKEPERKYLLIEGII